MCMWMIKQGPSQMTRIKKKSLWVMIKSLNDTSFTTLMKRNILINRDVDFNEEKTRDCKINNCEKYDFLLILNEERKI